LVVVLCGSVQAQVNDDFGDGTLDPGWGISFENANGWTFNESGGNLNVSDISEVAQNSWAAVRLRQDFSPVNDFTLDFDISWDSESVVQAMQSLYVQLFDASDNLIMTAGYGDAWIGETGREVANITGTSYTATQNSLPLSGSVNVDIVRDNGEMEIFWNSISLLSKAESTPVERLDVYIAYFPGSAVPWGNSIYGNEQVDRVQLQAVPEPGSLSLLLLGLGSLFLFRWR